MAKIMLVEDDTNLSEIYQARLTAEGYDIVSAHDGEEALALAAKEKPDLIVSDVMMPKISGFEMLDILRNTEGLKETKVIMLTALGQADDKTRADSLGADRYLVKSQVTLEDIVKAAQELLTGASTPAAVPAATDAAPAPAPTPVAAPVPMTPPTPAPMAVAAPPAPAPVPAAPAPVMPVAAPPMASPVPAPAPVAAAPVTPIAPAPVAIPVPQPAAVSPAPAPTPVAAPVPMTPPTPAPMASPVAAPNPVPAPPANPTTAADNKLVADAVEDLMEGVTGKPATAPTEVAAPAEVPDIADDMSDDGKENSGGSHKKIIKPISDDAAAPKPSLESLLADEERKNPGSTGNAAPSNAPAANAPVTEVPHQPGHIITPSAAESLNNGSGIDPNSIAL